MPVALPSSIPVPVSSGRTDNSRLQMKPFPLRPACRADERIFQWVGLNTVPMGTLNHPLLITIASLASRASLRDTSNYGSGLRKFHIFCDIFSISETNQLPASFSLLHSFALWAATDPDHIPAGSLDGIPLETISVTAIRKYLSAIRAWHIIQGWPITLSQDDLVRINVSLRGLERLQTNRRVMPPRPPITIRMLLALRLSLKVERPFDVCIWVIAVSAFWGMMRFEEVSVKTIKSFDGKLHLKRNDIFLGQDLDGKPYARLDLPSAKTAKPGRTQSVFLIEQSNICPLAVLRNLFNVVPARATDPLFSWTDDKGNIQPMMKQTAIKFINDIFTGWGWAHPSDTLSELEAPHIS
ncbi:hypothetical protein M422DRAFT_240048 [Sphaerobolus stellatus SS14]|nr:hypothetical protein M422DRAFT_240048 [Sphaerobolus stellatus SS14]